ncbi:MAG: type II toxin-antitoxin system RelE/ParE family toxin [Pirellulaceae bacterium]
MDYKVVWTDPAIENLRSIFDHIAEEQPENARGVVTRILERVETLAMFPNAGDLFRKKRNIRQVFSGVYRIFYRVLEAERRVDVLAVWHGSRRNPKLQ